MAKDGKTGVIEKTVLKKSYEETHIEWKIPNITRINEIEESYFFYESPSFFMNDASCYLELYPNSDETDFMRMFIYVDVKQKVSPEYNVSLKKLDGTIEHLVSGILIKIDKACFVMGDIIKRSQLLKRKSELAPDDVVTIICSFKRELTDCTESSNKTVPLKLISK